MTTAEHPILLNGPMVRAYKAGRKTQTRRLNGLDRFNVSPDDWTAQYEGASAVFTHINGGTVPAKCPYGKPGDRLWVKETFGIFSVVGMEVGIGYRADHPTGDLSKTDGGYNWRSVESHGLAHEISGKVDTDRWKPSIFMPRWACRFNPPITGVRIERLNDISEADAIAEGCKVIPREGRSSCYVFEGTGYDRSGLCHTSTHTAFGILWDEVYGTDSFGGDPWVWVIEFEPPLKEILS